jgi:anti-anti-sigma factor
MLEIKIQIEERNVLISLDGQFNALGAIEFDNQAARYSLESQNIILDFERVSFLSSAGVRSILKLEQALRMTKGTLYIARISSSVRQVLDISGLSKYLKITGDLENAYQMIEKSDQAGLHSDTETCSFRIRMHPGHGSRMTIWNKKYMPGTWESTGFHPILASTQEFSFSLGEGSFAQGPQPDDSQRGSLLSFGHFIGYRPYDQSMPFDYLITDPRSGQGVYLWDGISFEGDPEAELSLQTLNETPLSRIIQDLFTVVARARQEVPEVIGMMLELDFNERNGQIGNNSTRRTILLGAVAFHKNALLDRENPEIMDYFLSRNWHSTGGDIYYHASGAVIRSSGNNERFIKGGSVVEFDPVVLQDVVDIEDLLSIATAHGWIYTPLDIEPASVRRLKIVRKDESYFPDAWELIARDLYRNSTKLILTPIHGGFSASTFFADSFDLQGRRQLPTVLKIAGKQIIEREESNYHDYVKKYILNNSTSIMGTSQFQEWKGLCYSFVGITGPDSSVEWLTKHYKNRPVKELLPLFDKIFTHILKPWYGQPRLEIIHPYRDHDPRTVFFPDICRDAEEDLGIGSGEQFIFFPELQREIINPYWFLEHVFEQRKKVQKLWYRCITHRDLNMQNILLDEIENVYIIDFSETGLGNAVADFARLEPILKIEMSRLGTENDLIQLAEFEQGLLVPDKLDDMPVFKYQGDDPNVAKAYQVICRLRQYADTVTLFEKDLIPYLLAVLEWTYPVVCYKGVEKLRKRYSACSAALICEKILAISG